MEKKLIAVLSHKIVIDFAYFFSLFSLSLLTDYWHGDRAYENGSFRSGSFRARYFRPFN